ncbi:MAG: hypothetical protein SchgKO_04550 [Schleiferiaceae bacterium]
MMAQTSSVTFQVDMGSTTVSPNGVHIAGSFQGWSPNTSTMTQVGATTIYEFTTTVPSDSTYEFKFLNGDDWPDAEGVPAMCQVERGLGNDNRFIHIYKDTTLAAVAFAGTAPSGKIAWRFGVDMQNQTGVDTVSVAGNFQAAAGFPADWSPGETRLFNVNGNKPTLYERIVYLNTGTYEFKYLNGTAWGTDESPASACANGGGNRELVISGDTLPGEVCFGMCVACPSNIPTYNITLKVDMNGVCFFDTAMDSLDFAGPYNGWGATYTEFTDVDMDGVYELMLMGVDSGEFKYKSRVRRQGATNWEGGSDKIIALQSDTIMDIRCFGSDSYGPCATPVPASDIIFMVDFTQASVAPATNIYVMGDFTENQWQSGAIELMPVAGMPGVYSDTVNVCASTFKWKFVNGDVNTPANEEFASDTAALPCNTPGPVGGYEREHTRSGSTEILAFTYGTCDNFIGLEEVDLASTISVYPNPFNTQTTVEFQEGTYGVTLIDLAGRALQSWDNVEDRLEITRGDLPAGMYMLQVTDGKGNAGTIKLMIQ